MKRPRLSLPLLTAAALMLAGGVKADESEFGSDFWHPYDLGSASVAVPSPAGTNTLNCFVAANDGSYVAVWDDGDGAYVERRNPAGAQTWLWRPPEPRPDSQEVTRAVVANQSHVLWCSAQRWFYLALTNGAVASSNDWSLPYIDATKLVPQGDQLYVIYGNNASAYNTNMERQATVELNWPAGYWRAYAGTWMLDLSTRTNRTLRVARLGAGLACLSVHALALSCERSGGYTEHRVLGASTNGMYVASSLNWPDRTSYYFSHVSVGGTVTFQHNLTANQIITGAAILEGGWILSAQYVGEAESRHTLYRVDNYGRPHWQVQIAASATEQNVVLNTSPPRLLRFNGGAPWELRILQEHHWSELTDRLVVPSLGWDSRASDISPMIQGTGHVWLEPILPNNT